MRAHRGSSATDGGVGFRVLADVAVIFLTLSYPIAEMVPPVSAGHTPILAFKSNSHSSSTHLDALAGPRIVADNNMKIPTPRSG